MEEEIIIIIDPAHSPALKSADTGWSVKFVCNGTLSRKALRAAQRAINAKLAEMGPAVDED